MQDSIFLKGIRFHAFHGLTRLEREIGVRYSIDIDMKMDLLPAARSDRMADTIDYRKVHHLVVEIGRRESYRLIETLAEHLAEELVGAFPVDEVRVRVTKETPILDGILDAVGVEMTRTRAQARPMVRGRSADSGEPARRVKGRRS